MIDMHRPCLEEIVGDVPLNAAERRLIKVCKAGDVAWFGHERPIEGTPQNTIRAALIRHILLGGCDDVYVGPKGMQVMGAWITGALDLQGCESALDLALSRCHFCKEPVLRDARLGAVMLPGCAVPGLDAQRLKEH